MSQLLLHGLRAGAGVAQYAPRLVDLARSSRAVGAAAPLAVASPVPVTPADPNAIPPAAPATPGTPTTPAAVTVQFPDVYLTLMIWATAIAALIILFLPEHTAAQRGRIRTSAMMGSGFTFMLALLGFNNEIANDVQGGLPSSHNEVRGWLDGLGIHAGYHLTADGVTLALLAVTTLLFVVAVIASFKVEKHTRLYFALLMILETGVTGVLLANDLLLFLFFWGLQIMPLYLLIMRWGGAGRVQGARRYLHAAALAYGLITAGIVLIAVVAGHGTFDLTEIAGAAMPYGFTVVGFFLLFSGFAISMGTFPLHGWLAESHAEASAPVAAVASGAVVTVAGYGMLRVVFEVVGPASTRFSFLIVVLALLTIAYGAFSTLRQRELRRAVSHFSIAESGVVLLAIGCHSTTAVVGAVTLLIANALAIAALHLTAGAIESRVRTGRIDRLGGLGSQLPRLAGFWVLGVLSGIGVPLLAGFSGVFLVVIGSFPVHRFATAIAVVLLLISAAAVIRLTQRVLLGPTPEGFERLQDTDANELWQLVPIFIGVGLWGILPGRALPMVSNAVMQVIVRHLGGS